MEAKGKHTKWELRRSIKPEDAALLKIPEHEQYARGNDGSWGVFTSPDDAGEFHKIADACFRGKAKRGEAYRAPDPEGFANARLIAKAYLIPEVREVLKNVLGRYNDPDHSGAPTPATIHDIRDLLAALNEDA